MRNATKKKAKINQIKIYYIKMVKLTSCFTHVSKEIVYNNIYIQKKAQIGLDTHVTQKLILQKKNHPFLFDYPILHPISSKFHLTCHAPNLNSYGDIYG